MTKRTTTHLFIFLLCIYALTAGGHYGGDGFWNYLTAQSLMRDGDLVISDESFTLPEMQKHSDAITSSGRHYSKYGPGMPLAEIPFYAVGLLLTSIFPNIPADYLTMFTTSMTNVVISALWVLFFCFIIQSFNYPPSTTKWLTGAFALGTMVFPYSGYGYPEPLVGLGLLIATHALIKRHPSPILAGIGLSIAILTKFYTLVLLPIPLLYMRRNRYATSRRLAIFLSPIVAACLLIAYHNHLRYGNILFTGYHLDILAQKGGYLAFIPTQFFTAFYGLLFSTGRGLIFFFPLICLLPIAYHKFKSSHPDEARLFLGFTLILFALLLPMIDWHAGSSWGPRYLLPILPFCIFPLGALADIKWTRRLTVFGFFVQLPGTLMNPYLFTHFVQDKKIGATIFAPHQMGDLLFSPNLSPIIGGYYQITSAILRLTTGESLNYTISSGTERFVSASLKNYDLIDIWWVNVLRTNILSPTMTLALILVVICLILIAIYAARQAISYHHQKAESG